MSELDEELALFGEQHPILATLMVELLIRVSALDEAYAELSADWTDQAILNGDVDAKLDFLRDRLAEVAASKPTTSGGYPSGPQLKH